MMERGSSTGREMEHSTRMRPARLCNRIWLALLSILLLVMSGRPQNLALGGVQQGGSGNVGPRRGPGSSDAPFGDNSRDLFQEERRLRALNADRQKAMVGDAGKLLRLVAQFNAEIEQEQPESLSPNQMRKLAEIEKLARSVKEKMSTSVRMPSIFPAAIPGQYP